MKLRLEFLIILALSILPTGRSALAQIVEPDEEKSWSLKECTDYAIENNISLAQSRIEAENADIDLLGAKAGRYPSLSASIGQNLSGNWFNNSSEHKNSYSGSYGVGANWTLYNGGSVTRNIEEKANAERIQELSLSKNTLDLKVQIANYYIQILFDLENIKIKEEAALASRAQWERGIEFMKAGSMSKADCAKLESQYTTDLYQKTLAQSQYNNDLLTLKTAMRLQRSNMTISSLDIDESRILALLPDRERVYELALNQRPEIEMSRLNIENSELSLASAKGGYLPSISLSANTGTNNTSGTGTSFGRQLKTNWQNSVGLNISIPIYSQGQNRSAVQKAQNNLEYYKLLAQQEEDQLYTTIENLYLSALNSQQEYISARESFKSASESYKLVTEQFELGMKNIVELEQEKSTYTAAELSLAQAKYTALLNIQILKFYMGEEIDI